MCWSENTSLEYLFCFVIQTSFTQHKCTREAKSKVNEVCGKQTRYLASEKIKTHKKETLKICFVETSSNAVSYAIILSCSFNLKGGLFFILCVM